MKTFWKFCIVFLFFRNCYLEKKIEDLEKRQHFETIVKKVVEV